MVEVHGFCDDRFRELEAVFRWALHEDAGAGASLAVTLHGTPVVDLWGGWRDHDSTLPWEADTVVRVMSTSKVPVIIAALMAVERGLLDLDAPIAQYWPEFAAHGKGAVTSRQVLVHRSGVPGFGRSVPYGDLRDWSHAVALLEDAELWYEPGTTSCYHPVTFGFLLGEVVRRVTGVPFIQFMRQEVIEPLGVDFHFAITSPDDRVRVAAVWPPDQLPAIPSAMAGAVNAELTAGEDFYTPAGLAQANPGASGMTNARALARIGSMLAMGGELDGHRYLQRATIDEATREQSYAVDELFGPCRCGLGFGLDSIEYPAPTATTFHWGGFGGSFVTMDMATGVSCGYTPSRLRGDLDRAAEPHQHKLWRALGDACRQLD